MGHVPKSWRVRYRLASKDGEHQCAAAARAFPPLALVDDDSGSDWGVGVVEKLAVLGQVAKFGQVSDLVLRMHLYATGCCRQACWEHQLRCVGAIEGFGLTA